MPRYGHRPALPCAALALSLALGACFPATTWFGPSGLTHPEHEYGIAWAPDADPPGLLGDDWRLVNFRRAADGAPTLPMIGGDHMGTVRVDTDHDGRPDVEREMNRYDVRYQHRDTRGEIWVSTFPLGDDAAARSLSVQSADLVESMAGAHTTAQLSRSAFALTDDGLKLATQEKRYAAETRAAGPLVVSGREAHRVVVDLRNLDVSETGPRSVQRIELILVRTGVRWIAWTGQGSDPDTVLPLFMAIGYVNDAEDFAAHEPDLRDLVARIHIGKGAAEEGGEGEACVGQGLCELGLACVDGRCARDTTPLPDAEPSQASAAPAPRSSTIEVIMVAGDDASRARLESLTGASVRVLMADGGEHIGTALGLDSGVLVVVDEGNRTQLAPVGEIKAVVVVERP